VNWLRNELYILKNRAHSNRWHKAVFMRNIVIEKWAIKTWNFTRVLALESLGSVATLPFSSFSSIFPKSKKRHLFWEKTKTENKDSFFILKIRYQSKEGWKNYFELSWLMGYELLLTRKSFESKLIKLSPLK
jgi:hypothetical protein